jgi:hypothetical protein
MAGYGQWANAQVFKTVQATVLDGNTYALRTVKLTAMTGTENMVRLG